MNTTTTRPIQVPCPECDAPLLLRSSWLGDGPLRCAACATQFEFDGQSDTARVRKPNRFAWRSLWLGLSSILLLFLTGVPAVYYGVRALLQMRYQRPTSRERAAAIGGTVLGTLFGMLMGGCVLSAGVVLALFFLTFEQTDDPAAIQRQLDRMAHVDIPEGITPRRMIQVMNLQTHVGWDDRQNEDDRPNVAIRLIFYQKTLSMNYSQIQQNLKATRIRIRPTIQLDSTEILDWEMDGKPAKITHNRFAILPEEDAPPSASTDAESNPAEPLPRRADRYYGFVVSETGAVGMAVFVFDPPGKLDQKQIEEMFASLKMISPGISD